MRLDEKITQLLTPSLTRMGYDIVRILRHDEKRTLLEIMIERQDRKPVSMRDCVLANKEISIILDVEEPFAGAFVLEVTSPGFDRPLVKAEDYKRFVGKRVKVHTNFAVDQQKRFIGMLKDFVNEKVVIEVEVGNNEGQILEIPIEEIRKAHLIPEFDKEMSK